MCLMSQLYNFENLSCCKRNSERFCAVHQITVIPDICEKCLSGQDVSKILFFAKQVRDRKIDWIQEECKECDNYKHNCKYGTFCLLLTRNINLNKWIKDNKQCPIGKF